MIEEVWDHGVGADVVEVPVAAAELCFTEGAHLKATTRLTDLISGGVEVNCEEPVQEHEQTYYGSRQQPPGIEPWWMKISIP